MQSAVAPGAVQYSKRLGRSYTLRTFLILTGKEIEHQHALGAIRISDFSRSRLSPNSYDLTLGDTLLRYAQDTLDPRIQNETELITIPPDGYKVNGGSFLVATCAEEIGSEQFVPLLHGKSGLARLGLFTHITADLLHLGFFGHPTLQIYSVLPVIIYARMPIAQVSFWTPRGKIIPYAGKNQGCILPYSGISMEST